MQCTQYYSSSFYKYLQGTSTWCDRDKYGNNFCPRGRGSIISFLSSRRNARGIITDKGCELSSPDRTSSSSTPSPPSRRRRCSEIDRARQLQSAIALQPRDPRARLNRETRAFLLFFSPASCPTSNRADQFSDFDSSRCLDW